MNKTKANCGIISVTLPPQRKELDVGILSVLMYPSNEGIE